MNIQIQQAIDAAKEERKRSILQEHERVEALHFGVCPDCGGKLKDMTGFFRRYIIGNERLYCCGCGALHIRRVAL